MSKILVSLLCEFVFFAFSVFDLILNLEAKDLPEYHNARIKLNTFSLFTEASSIIFLIILFCNLKSGVYLVLVYGCLICVVLMVCFYYLIKSFYLYFSYDGYHKIKNIPIHIFMYISLIKCIYSICYNCFIKNNLNSSTESHESDEPYNKIKNSNNKSDENNEGIEMAGE